MDWFLWLLLDLSLVFAGLVTMAYGLDKRRDRKWADELREWE